MCYAAASNWLLDIAYGCSDGCSTGYIEYILISHAIANRIDPVDSRSSFFNVCVRFYQ